MLIPKFIVVWVTTICFWATTPKVSPQHVPQMATYFLTYLPFFHTKALSAYQQYFTLEPDHWKVSQFHIDITEFYF